ncbi:hypothetical protein [Paenibacillus durus]|uniref:hypothetical protein n=1 Tax=Paenibacillus durus TaxID=44251 RepID=UPI0012DFF993|nr:hypothetical protein [Paenibacillus durus]
MEKFMFGRNTFTMFVLVEMSDYRTCIHHTSVLIRTIVTRRGYQVIPQCRAWYASVSWTIGSVGNHYLGFDSPIACDAILAEYSTFNRARTCTKTKG